MKGSKYHRWYKEGLVTSRKWYKNVWNRRVRHSKTAFKNSDYKRLAGCELWNGII